MLKCRLFEDTFGRPLDDFWIDNARGLDLEKFDREVVFSGELTIMRAIYQRWGKVGLDTIKRLLPKESPHRKVVYRR
jgi:hypothetical protein